jgi:type II secretory pathway component PulK
MREVRRERGAALALVLVLVLVLSAAIYTFSSRAVVDAVIARNRDAAAQAEALARGGVQLATALLLQDLIPQETGQEGPSADFDTLDDLWAQVGEMELSTPEGASLRLHIRDAGANLGLNGLVDFSEPNAAPDPDAEEFLVDFLSKVIEEIPLPPGEKFYDPRELARNLIDYLDPDEVRISGGAEDDRCAPT